MFISDFAIKKPLITVVAMVTLAVFGLFALFKLKTDEFPDIAPPVVTVGIPYPGASPDGVEKEILDPIEEQITSISGVKHVNGSAFDGFAFILVEFEFGKDLAEASQDLRDAISAKRADLPVEMKEPIIKKFNDTDRPIVSLALSSTTLSQAELTRLADPTITRELRSIAGVAEVAVSGKVERELTVELDPARMQSAGVSVGQIVQALSLQNLAAPVGRVTGAMDERAIRLKGRLENAQEFTQLVVSERNGVATRLGDVAEVRDGTEEPRTLALFNDKEAVGIDIKKAKGYSTTDVSDKIRARVEQLQSTLGAGTKLELVRDSGTRVDAAVRNVEEALLEGAFLTVLVVFLFLNSWRSTVITGLALPVSVLASFIAVWLMGFKLETMSLLGLSLAIGILIDDAIVVRENIVRHVEMGKDHFRAAHEGTDEIGLAVAATTFSIVAVFVPIGFMSGLSGQWFKPFALTIACSVLVSLFVSFSLDPMLSAYWPDPELEEHQHRSWVSRKLVTFNAWFDRMAQRYTGVIGWALDHRLAMVGLAAFSLVGALWLQSTFGGFGFIPVTDNSEFTIQVETPPGSNLEYTRIKAEEAARLARSHSEVRYTFTTIGAGGGMDPSEALGAVDIASVYVRLTPKAERSITQDRFGAQIREEVKQIGGATAAVFTNGFGGAAKQVQLELRGSDARQLQSVADTVMAALRAIPGAVDVSLSTKGQKPELEISLNRALAGSLGVSVGQIAQSLRPAFAGVDAGDWIDPAGENRKVRVRLAPEARTRIQDIERLPIAVGAPGGRMTMMPLGQLASVSQGLGPAKISHLDRENVIVVQSNVQGRSLGEVTSALTTQIEKLNLPDGVRWSFGGEAKDQAQVFGDILAALGIAFLLMYLILVMQFGSFLEPIAILISLPLSLIGVVLALLITGDTLNIMSMIGVILLMGIVAKNAILLIDFAKWGQEQGMDRREAIIEAGRVRLRPIMMTTLALIAGMIPVALGIGEGADFRAPLGRAIIGGTITSTVLTLLVIPTIYEIMDDWRRWISGFFSFPERPKTGEYAVPVRK